MLNSIKINGKEYPIRYDLNAIILFKDLSGIDLMTQVVNFGTMDAKQTRALFFVGLKSGAKAEGKPFEMTEEDVGYLMGPEAINEIVKQLTADTPVLKEGEQPGEQ